MGFSPAALYLRQPDHRVLGLSLRAQQLQPLSTRTLAQGRHGLEGSELKLL